MIFPYPRWLAELDELDSELTKNFRRDEFWYVLEVAGVFMTCKPGWYLLNGFYVGQLLLVLLEYELCVTISLFKMDTLSGKSQLLNYAVLIFLSSSIIVITNFKRRHLLRMFDICARGFYDYGFALDLSSLNYSSNLFRLFKKAFLVALPTWLCTIGASVLLGDYIDSFFGYDTTVNATYVNGIYQRTPFKMYYFYQINTEFKRYVTLFSLLICCSGEAWVICSFDLLTLFLGQKLIVQMQILNVAIRDTDMRADKLYEISFRRAPPKDGLARKNDRELMKMYNKCLQQTLDHHGVILEFADLYNDLFSFPLGVSVMIGGVMVAMSIISFTQGGEKPSLMVTSVLLVVAEISSLLMVCEIGQIIRETSEEFFGSMYMFQWMDCSERVKKNIRIMKTRLVKPIRVIGVITEMNRDTFGGILNKTYSYINLVRATQ